MDWTSPGSEHHGWMALRRKLGWGLGFRRVLGRVKSSAMDAEPSAQRPGKHTADVKCNGGTSRFIFTKACEAAMPSDYARTQELLSKIIRNTEANRLAKECFPTCALCGAG